MFYIGSYLIHIKTKQNCLKDCYYFHFTDWENEA